MPEEPGLIDKISDYLFPARKVLRGAAAVGDPQKLPATYDDAAAVRQMKQNQADAQIKLANEQQQKRVSAPASSAALKALATPPKRKDQ